ncbi:MAG: hypothetical protein M9952_02145 [Microthrixaceae bacterium]|nr:hypothetical protein [Microthrixaceae bacterium]
MKVKRWIAVGLTAAVATVGLEAIAPVGAGATAVSINCQGITGDNASSLGDSKATLGLLSSISPGGGSGLSFPAEITTNAPAKVQPNAGPFNADFNLTMTMPASLMGPARDLLGLSAVTVTDATYAIQASGAASTLISKTVPSEVISLTSNPVVIQQSMSGTITPTGPGAIIYSVSASTRLTIAINQSVAGVQINALTVTCTGGNDIGMTAVQIPGSPNVAQPLNVAGYTAAVTGLGLLGSNITPDNNNAIHPDTLAVTAQAPNGGYTAVGGGAAFFLAPQEPGYYVANYNVCAGSLPVAAIPGANATQTLTWPESYADKGLNAHPLSMRLGFKGQTTSPISLAQLNGQPSPSNEKMLDFFHRFFGKFVAPSPTAVQTALEKLSTIGKGNVKVTRHEGGGYDIEFVGSLADAPQPAIEIAEWNTWLPSDGLASLMALMPGASGGEAGGAAPKTADQLNNELMSGAIKFDEWLEGQGELLKANIIAGATTPEMIANITAMFPKSPEVAVVNAGKTTIPASETGPLCSPFQIGYFIVPNPFLAAQVQSATATRTKKVKRCSYKKVKSKGKWVKKRVCRTVTVKA